jgi:integrase
MCDRIKKDIGFEERITPIRFRTTVLSDIYAGSKDIKKAQAAAGHTTAAMTLKHYIKNRECVVKTASIIEAAYS